MIGWCFNVSFPFLGNSFSNFRDFCFQFLVLLVYNIQKILANVRTAIDASNTVVGEYMCQGRMPQAVRDRYMKMKEMPDAKPNLDALIENFDQALSHPDQEDLEKLRKMIAG